MPAPTHVALPLLPRTLAERYPGVRTPTYHRCYVAAIDGRIPTEMRGSRYFVRSEDLPAVAEALGLDTEVVA